MKVGASDHLSIDGRRLVMPSGFTVSEATPGAGDVTIVNGGSSAADYAVTTLGSTIYATPLNGNGLASFSGPKSDAAPVIQAAINALKGRGGKIAYNDNPNIGAGGAGLILYPGMELEGPGFLAAGGSSGWGALTAAAALNGPIITIQIDAGNPGFNVFPCLRNMTIIGAGSNAAQTGVTCPAGDLTLDVIMENVGVFSTPGYCADLENASTKMWMRGCYLEHAGNVVNTTDAIHCNGTYLLALTGCYLYSATGVAISNGASGIGTLILTGCALFNNVGGAFDVGPINHEGEIAACAFFDNGTAFSARVKNSSAVRPVAISGNTFRDDRGAGAVVNHIIYSSANVTNIAIDGNDFIGSTGDAIVRGQNLAGDAGRIYNNRGFNDTKGLITNVIENTNHTFSLKGATAVPAASVDYLVQDCDQYIVSTGGTGVSITIKDPKGNTVQSGLATLNQEIKAGWKINFGAFSVAPTVASYVL